MENDPHKLPFLSLVAKDLLARFGNDLSGVAVVFPGRRARLFFNKFLCEHSDQPVWAPRYLSMDDIFQEAANMLVADEIKLICELYNSYIKVYNSRSASPSEETLDEFFFFGEVLLQDFDDIDKNLVNVRSLFSNLQDLDMLRDDFSHLDQEQIEIIMRYFRQTFLGETALQKSFWSVWNILGDVYTDFREKLAHHNLAYPGMLMRSVMENEEIEFPCEHYVFIGFNALNKCEEKLFRRLNEQALFYWDFDHYYLKPEDNTTNEAGRFIQRNISKFGSALPVDLFDNFIPREKKISYIASPSESGQASLLPRWLDMLGMDPAREEPDTAIVLCNEMILPTIMHSVPAERVRNVNITMGFPITQTPVSSFLQVLTEMQIKGYIQSTRSFRYKFVLPVLRHPYTTRIFPEAKEVETRIVKENVFFPTLEVLRNSQLFSYASSTAKLVKYLLDAVESVGKSYENQEEYHDIYTGLYQESNFRAYQVINRLSGLIGSGELAVEKTTFLRLLRKLLSTTKIPFHGEPVKGLQVMGLLETRNLDFKNVILLSVNEGFMPATDSDNTFIPQFIRRHFELATTEHQDSLYAYYFYRLLQRAENITFVYNTDKTQTGKSEMSRFLLQMLIDPRLKVKRFAIQSEIKPLQKEPVQIAKTPAMLEKLKISYDWNFNPLAYSFSPSALNIFIDCSLRFYLKYIEGLKTKDDISDELDVSVFGTIFHRAAEILYREIGGIDDINDFKPYVVRKEHIDFYLKSPHLTDRIILTAFGEVYFKDKEITRKQFNGEQLINFRVISHMLRRLLIYDRRDAPFIIHGLEKKVYAGFELGNTGVTLKVGGIIDRFQEKDGKLYIIDYKTGGSAKPCKEIAELTAEKENRASYIFQAFTYSSVLIKNRETRPIVPCLIYLQDAGKENYSSIIQFNKEEISDFATLYPEFIRVFENKISELFNPDIPFCQSKLVSTCTYCDFKNMCNR